MYGDLASIRETIDLSAREALDDALTFLTGHGYRTSERTDTSLTVTRPDQSDAKDGDQPSLTVLALPQPEGGVQVTVRPRTGPLHAHPCARSCVRRLSRYP